ncbi:unnamed protein product [Larinioides sclopetarius]|uniref:Uncharacterized protein n=1 Tax=Larinioides sclopetarius TaxID=280406 RepID=A0AAV1Z689_9ARAC
MLCSMLEHYMAVEHNMVVVKCTSALMPGSPVDREGRHSPFPKKRDR